MRDLNIIFVYFYSIYGETENKLYDELAKLHEKKREKKFRNVIISMLNQFEVLPLDSPAPMILFWILIVIFCLIILLTDPRRMSKKLKTLIYLITIFYAGFLLKGIPNVLVPVEYTLTMISERGDLLHIIHPITIFSIIMGSSYLVGRIFCGFVCPIGALQELISYINFKSDLKDQKENKIHIDVSSQVTNKVRWAFIGVLFLLASIWDIAVLPNFNPLSGFMLTLFIPFFGLASVGVASVFLYRPWCRFLCPFGAGSALIGRNSIVMFRRTVDCTDCGLCEKICPTKIFPGECYYCNRCVEICPHNAIKFDILY
jgi:polyferredoxin